jgi:large subunit ribosomal protein L28
MESENRFIKLRVSAKGMRIIDKLGIEQVVEDMRAKGQKV